MDRISRELRKCLSMKQKSRNQKTLQNEGVIGYFTEDEQQSLKDHKQEGTDLGFIQTKRYMREDWNI